jgi:hypothetical protein
MSAESVADPGQGVTTRTLTIPDGIGGAVRFTLQLPTSPVTERLPTLILLAGIKTNEETLARISDQGDNALVAYHYDYDQSTWNSLSHFRRALIVHRMACQITDQVVALVEWVKSQRWADAGRVNIGGGSLGAISLPMILRELQARGIKLRTSIFAYGGAGLATLGYLSLRHRSPLLAAVGGGLAWLFLRRLEPARHLHHLRGEFLIISSPDDQLVHRRCSKLFEDLTPEPKTIIHMQGMHVNTRERKLLADVIAVAHKWLTEQGALNP